MAPSPISKKRKRTRSRVLLPQPECPTTPVVRPASTRKDRRLSSHAGEAALYLKHTSLNSMEAPAAPASAAVAPNGAPAGGARSSGRASGASRTPGCSLRSANSLSMSTSACRVSRYTMPIQLSGIESWKSRPFTSTRSPTDMLPSTMPCATMSMMAVRPAEKMTFWPTFRKDSEVCVRSAAAWKPTSDLLYRFTSCASALKYLTVS
jgi:hypothetical protein